MVSDGRSVEDRERAENGAGGHPSSGVLAQATVEEPDGIDADTRARERESVPEGRRVRLEVLNHYFVPDVASTGHLLAELVDALADTGDFDVSVITCRPCYGPPESWQPAAKQERRDGVYIRRLQATRFSKDSLPGRAVNYLSFMLPLAVRQFVKSNKDTLYLYTTNPPFLGIVGVVAGLIRPHRYVMLLHDAYPQLAVLVGTFRAGGVVEKVWHWVNKRIYRHAEHTIVLCSAAKDLVCETYGVDPSRVSVIPNWADGDELHPVPKAETEFANANGFVEPFTLLYSGNLGLYYEFETLLDAAEALKGEPFRLVFIGSGGKKQWIAEQVKKRGLANVELMPYQPSEKLNDSLNACDASLVTIAKGIEGISFPSKLYSSLAVGKAIVSISEPWSELRRLVEHHRVGIWAENGDADALVAQLREYIADPQRAVDDGRRARELFDRKYTLEKAAERYHDVFWRASPQNAPNPAGPATS